MELVFLTPAAALIGLAVVVPAGAAALRARRDSRVRRVLGLVDPSRTARFGSALAGAALVACLAAAAAQPAVQVGDSPRVRTDAQVLVVLDTSRSMLAAADRTSPTRFERAASLAMRLRTGLGGVPTGVASLTDRLLPHLFPTADERTFERVVRDVVGVDQPPPSVRSPVATDLSALFQLGEATYFTASAERRLAVVLTDGESSVFSPPDVAKTLRRARIRLVLVRLWSPRERLFVDGRPDPGYRPDAAAIGPLTRLASLAGGRVYSEGERSAIMNAAREALGQGPTVAAGRQGRTVPLAPWAALAGVVPLAWLLRRR